MNTFKATYTAVNESIAKTAKHMNSFGEYKEGTATNTQKYYVDEIVKYAESFLGKETEMSAEKLEKVQYYIDKYSVKIAEAIDKDNAIRSRVPSIMIAGGSNFPTRAKEKQDAAHRSHWEKTAHLYKTDRNNYYYNKIRLCLTDSGAIKSDDKDAVLKIKEKIERLSKTNDAFGYNKTEIRRLKQRLLELAPDEVKAGKEITVNGMPATFENIVSIFDGVVPTKCCTDEEIFYLPMVKVVFSDGKRKYAGFLSNRVSKDCKEFYSSSKSEFVPFTDVLKFKLAIATVRGSGNKAIIFSILQDLNPELQKQKEEKTYSNLQQTAKINGEEVKIVDNQECMQLQVFFDGKPEAETRSIMKSNGFKWAPSQGAWQRLSNENARYALNKILEK